MTNKPEEIVFRAINHHGASCGIPPYIDTRGKEKYYGYFENESREQFIFVYEYQTKKATLWVGDNGWDNPITIKDGKAPEELLMSENEVLWLQVCWRTATAVNNR